jgi:hypothetical protein
VPVHPLTVRPPKDRSLFWHLVTEVVGFCDARVGQCFLGAREKLDAAATLVLALIAEAGRSAGEGQELGVTVLQFEGLSGTNSISQQIPLNHIQLRRGPAQH